MRNGFSLEGRKRNAALLAVKDKFLLLKASQLGRKRERRRERQGREKEDDKKKNKQVR